MRPIDSVHCIDCGKEIEDLAGNNAWCLSCICDALQAGVDDDESATAKDSPANPHRSPAIQSETQG